MADWLDFAGGAISSAASVLGIPWQQDLQKDLMHENEAINIAQWNRENKYNSPKEQMKRLKEAGLNPDLVYGGNVANTAGSAQVTAGTPQAPGAANAVSQAVRNFQVGALTDSEISKNESEANRNNAQAGEHSANTEFKLRTMDDAVAQVAANLGFTKQQTMESIARTNLFGTQVEECLVRIENLHTTMRLTNAQILGQYQTNRLTAANADFAFKRLARADEYIDAEINQMISVTGLNNAHAANFRYQTSLGWATFKANVAFANNLNTEQYWKGFTAREQYQYQRGLKESLNIQLHYMPFQFLDVLMNAQKYYKHDDKGNIIMKDGMPVIDDGYANYMKTMEMASSFLDNMEKFSFSAYGLTGAIGNLRGVPSLNPVAVKAGKRSTTNQNPYQTSYQGRSVTKEEDAMFMRWINQAKSKNQDLEPVFKRIDAYKNKHGIY